MNPAQKPLKQRMTFAVISHPDSGKTTITEKLLLFGGAIHIAGAVKSGKNSRASVSDFMEIEKERGISISTSVMGFEYGGRKINILDTPGHADFSEDTYRGLSAVDSALLVIDSVKGVEERTRSLCEVCRMRRTPIATFINKLDREGKDPMEVLDEVERELGIGLCPITWPVRQGRSFKGVYDLQKKQLLLFFPGETRKPADTVAIKDLDDPLLLEKLGLPLAKKLKDDIALLSGVYPPFNKEDYLEGRVTPVFFGSAINNFGISELLDTLCVLAPPPSPKHSQERVVNPDEDKFTGFVFKIHANMNPRHRNRVAFLRICSGSFERNKSYYHVRAGKPFRSANPTAFMAQDSEIIEAAFPGDIIGINDTGSFKIGDTITEGEAINFRGIPSFAPQIFRYIVNADPLKEKQYKRGLDQLAEEGVVQIFSRPQQPNVRVLGVVGQLQLEVLQYRMEHEYGAKCNYKPIDLSLAHWFTAADPKVLEAFIDEQSRRILVDIRGEHVLMSESVWQFERTKANNPALSFYSTSELSGETA